MRLPHKKSRALQLLFALSKGAVMLFAIPISIASTAHISKEVRRWGYRFSEDISFWEYEDFEKWFLQAARQYRLSQAVRSIRKRRWVRLVAKGGKLSLEITEEGKRVLVYYELDRLIIHPQEHWDGIWRIVLFDIPEKYRVGRDMLRKKLTELGFLAFQKSAFVIPYPCRNEIDFVVQAYGLTPYVTFFEAPELGYQETKALAHFSLVLPKRRPKRQSHIS